MKLQNISVVIVEKIRHILQSEPALRPGSGPSEKVDPGHLEKADPTPECVILVKSYFLINLKVLISNFILVFSNISSKIPK